METVEKIAMRAESFLMRHDFLWINIIFIRFWLHITIFLFLSPAIILFMIYSGILYGIFKYNDRSSVIHRINLCVFYVFCFLTMPWLLNN